MGLRQFCDVANFGTDVDVGVVIEKWGDVCFEGYQVLDLLRQFTFVPTTKYGDTSRCKQNPSLGCLSWKTSVLIVAPGHRK